MRQPLETTEREQRVAGALATGVVVLGFAMVVLTNVTDSWWPVIVGLPILAVVGLALLLWIARNHGRGVGDTFLASMANTKRRT